jgi:membrane-associated phospholipid phosphatase
MRPWVLARGIIIVLTIGIPGGLNAAESGTVRTAPDASSGKPVHAPDTLHLDLTYFKGYVKDARTLAAAPAHWIWSDWLTASLVAAGGVGLYVEDRRIQTKVQENRTNAGDVAASIVEPLGNGYYLVGAFGVFYLSGVVLKNEGLQSTTLLCAESVVLARGVTEVLKQGLHRHRPNESSISNDWDGPGISTHHLSFPSGHTTAAAALASALATRYRESPMVGIIAYTLAACTGFSRINDNAHWASDVFTGYVIGWYCGRVVAKSHIHKSGPDVSPYFDGDRTGILLSFGR